jgi:endonuclease/exonuclease/phosphatase (EEP) superfamily protein YafD
VKQIFALFLVGSSAAAFLAGAAFGAVWWADLFAHFMPYYLVVFAAVLAFGPGRRLRGAALALVAVAAVVLARAPLDYSGPPTGMARAAASQRDFQTIKVVSLNVDIQNTDWDRLDRLVGEASPDLAFFAEVTPATMEALRRIAAKYGYAIAGRPRNHPYGAALLAKGDIADVRYFEPGEDEPKLQAIVRVAGVALRVGGVHLSFPLHPRTAERQRWETERIVEFAGDRRLPTIILGDFNATPWSYVLRRLDADAGLRASFHTLAGTWPSGLPLRIPIDHVFALHGARSLSSEIGPAAGSDHLPVVALLAIDGSAGGP